MTLADLIKGAAIVTGAGLLLVLWTEHAYRRGYDAAKYECEYEVST
jgi:hypothetical protein